jgi:hypothetical protein
MARRHTKHTPIALLLLSLLAQSFAYAYAPCPEQMDMASSMLSMSADHSAMNMADPKTKNSMSDSADNCCDTQQSNCPKSSCAAAALLSSSTIISLHPAPQTRAKLTTTHPNPAPITSLYRPPIYS